MCGIVGSCSLKGEPVSEALLRRMTDAIAHRGPDDEGWYVDGPIGLGNRRLAIVDLSNAGHQPMASESGDVVIVYNGEIYNFQSLRCELEQLGHGFRSRTDTEVLVHAYEQWGAACVERLNGMFAFAIWDRPRRRVMLFRDRYGVKPLYWWLQGGQFIFASEVKAILEHPYVSVGVSHAALAEYFTFQNVLSDLTLFEGIRMLPAGHLMSLDTDGGDPVIRKYWDFSPPSLHDMTEADAAERIYHLASQAVTRQLVADVPVGSYLSGGIDSSLIVSFASRDVQRLSTFTGGFDMTSISGLELSFDERPQAEELASLLKSEHYEVVMHAGDMERVLPSLIWHLEDPRVGQCYPNYYVARLASKFVGVVLSGAGGDELFGGYPWRYGGVLGSSNREDFLQRLYGLWQRLVPDAERPRFFTAAARHRMADHSPFYALTRVADGWRGPFERDDDYVAAALYFEQKTFLQGLLLVEDKLSMAHSLETRLPFLDNELVEFATALPVRLKLRNLAGLLPADENIPGFRYTRDTSEGKQVLRKAAERVVPATTVTRSKRGFSAPDASWFRGESIDYINRLLRDRRALVHEFIEPTAIERVLDQHCSGKANRRLLIWSLLSFEWWCRCFLGGETAEPTDALERAHTRR